MYALRIVLWKAYTKNSGDSKLKKQNFIEFFNLTWLKAFALLEETLKNDKKMQMLTNFKMQEWASANLSNLVKELDNEWKKYTDNEVKNI